MPVDYEAVRARIATAVGPECDAGRALALAVSEIKAAMPEYTWVGIYLLRDGELVLGPFLGKPSPHTRIPVGRGICGAAAAEKQTIVVDDVETRSEIVVPIMRGDLVIGEVDVDSDRAAAFGPKDRALLEAVAAMLGDKLSG